MMDRRMDTWEVVKKRRKKETNRNGLNGMRNKELKKKSICDICEKK